MATVNPEEQENQTQESVKLERNTKGYNWSIRLVFMPGETEDDFLRRLSRIDRQLRLEYGGER